MQTQASPMDPNDGVRLIFVTVVGVIMIMTDLLVSGIARPAWALAPPATLFLVPALGLGTDTGVVNFLLIAVGYLGILVAEGLNTTARWTRGLSRDSADGFGKATPVVWRAAAYLAVPALVAAIVLGVALPTLSLPGFGFGSGAGGGPLQLTDPTLDLRRNLNQARRPVVIEYQTEAPGRGVPADGLAAPSSTPAGWSNVRDRPELGQPAGADPGSAVETVGSAHHRISGCCDFGSQYLPLPYAPRSYDAAGRMALRPAVPGRASTPAASRDDLRGLEYSVESADIEPTAEDLARPASDSGRRRHHHRGSGGPARRI